MPGMSLPSPLALWQELLDAMSHHDSLGYLRRRCPKPVPAGRLFARLASEQRALRGHLRALALSEADAGQLEYELDAFFTKVQALACRHSRQEADDALVNPWDDERPAGLAELPPERALAILQDTSRRLLSELDLKHLLPLLVERAAELTGARVAFLALRDPETGAFDVAEAFGLPPFAVTSLPLSAEVRAWGMTSTEPRGFQVADYPALRALLAGTLVERAIAAPLRYLDQPLGVLCCALRPEHGDEAALCELLALLANQTTIAIRNAAHYREIVQKAAALHAANEQLRTLDQMKDQFLATVSHELRTPLNFITGFGTILLAEDDENLTDEQRHFIRKMLDGAFQLLALVNDLLDYSRIQSGQFTIFCEPCEPAAFLAAASEQFALMAAQHELELVLETPSGLPCIWADRQRLSQVLTNLVANAIKFTPARGRVRVSAEREGGAVRFSVEDTGPGIPLMQQAQLFQRFSQLDGSSTRAAGGTGLGLAISKSLVEAQGGTIGVVSPVPGQTGGCRFSFTVPLDASSTVPLDAASTPPLERQVAEPARRPAEHALGGEDL